MPTDEKDKKPDLSDPATWRKMSSEDFKKYLAEGLEIPAAGGGVYRFTTTRNPFIEYRKKLKRGGGE